MTGTERSTMAELTARLDVDIAAQRLITAVQHDLSSLRNSFDSVEAARTVAVQAVTYATHSMHLEPHRRTDPDPAILVELPTSVLKAGAALGDLLRAYQIGARVVVTALTETARACDSHLLGSAITGILRACDLIAAATMQVHAQLTPHVADHDERVAGQLLAEVVSGRTPTMRTAPMLARIGFDPSRACWPFAIAPCGRSPRRLVELLWRNGMLAALVGDVVQGLTGDATALFTRPVISQGVVILGEPASDVTRVDISDLGLAALLARAAGRFGVVPISDFFLELLIRRSPQLTEDLRNRVLGPLSPHPELVETLHVLMDHEMDRTVAARKLYVHRNTMSHRLRRIQELTGRRLNNPRDLALLYLAGMPAQPVALASRA